MKQLITVLLMMIMLVSGATVASAAEIPDGVGNAGEVADAVGATEYAAFHQSDVVIQVSGYIIQEAKQPGTPGNSGGQSGGSSPKMGDESQAGYLFLMMELSALAILLCVKARRDDDDETIQMQLQ